MSELTCKPLQIWSCKIGECPEASLPIAADSPMRDAVAEAYTRITGHAPTFIFSGWNDDLTEEERAVHEDRIPNDCPPTRWSDEYVSDLQQQLAAAQARCRDMEREIETLTTCGCEGCDDNLEESAFCFPCMNKVQQQVTQLQTTLAAREADYDRMRDQWSLAVQDAERLRSVLKKIAKPALGGKQQQWLAQEALKGA